MKGFAPWTLMTTLLAIAAATGCGDGGTDGGGAPASGGEGGSGGSEATTGGAPAGGSTGDGGAPPQRTCDDPFDPVSFAADVQPILTSSCAKSGCHSGVNPDARLDLREGSAHVELVNAETTQCSGSRVRVIPGDLAESYLFDKLLGIDLCGTSKRMPYPNASNPPLDEAELDVIAAWICGGALDD